MKELTKDIINTSPLLQFIGINKSRTQIKKILKKRAKNPWEVFLSWESVTLDLSKVAYVSNIIQKIAFWPNALYIPNDELIVLIADYDGSFTDFYICNELEKYFQKTVSVDDFQLSYLDFLIKYI